MTATGRVRAAVVAGAGVCGLLLALTPPAGPALAQPDCAEPGQEFQPVPWAQLALAPERVWPFTRGAGVTVAVLSSGVDAGHPQLAGRVEPGLDALAGSGPADDDCLGLGTQVAGVIAGAPSGSVGFAGLAPAATILPVRIVASGGAPAAVEPEVLAEAVSWAADRADILTLPVPAYTDHPAVEAAVRAALAGGTVVVAAAGDLGDEGDDSDASPTPYPAAYDGVLGVGAVDPDATRWSGSPRGDYLDLVAPGVVVVTLQRGGGMTEVTGTGVAAGFVAAAAALVKATARGQPAGRIVARLLATATPAPLGPASPEYGRGLVNPYAAVHERLVDPSPAPLPAVARPQRDPQPAWADSRALATAGALAAAGAFLAVVVAAVALPRGRRRSWRAGMAAPPVPDREPAEPGPPRPLFEER